MSYLASLVPIMVAFIGVIGTIAPYLIDKYFTNNEDNPLLNFKTDIGDYSIIINLTNHGKQPATNMNLYMDVFPFNISNITNIFSTTDIYYNNSLLDIGEFAQIGNTNTKLNIPKFIQGEGSFILLIIFFPEYIYNTNLKFSLMSVFDQGSVRKDLTSINQPNILILASISNQIFTFTQYVLYLVLLYFALAYVYLIYRGTIGKRKIYFKLLLDRLLKIRRLLQFYIQTIEDFQNVFDKTVSKSKSSHRSANLYVKLRNLLYYKEGPTLDYFRKFEIKDFILLDEFNTLLEKRNKLLESNDKLKVDKSKLKQINENLLSSLNEVLIKVNWKKYL